MSDASWAWREGPVQRQTGPSKWFTVIFRLLSGDLDPWMALSVVRNGTREEKHRAVLIQSSAHCADMNPPRNRDTPTLLQARKVRERERTRKERERVQEYKERERW